MKLKVVESWPDEKRDPMGEPTEDDIQKWKEQNQTADDFKVGEEVSFWVIKDKTFYDGVIITKGDEGARVRTEDQDTGKIRYFIVKYPNLVHWD